MKPMTEILAVRALLNQHLQRTVAFTRENPEEAHRQADRLASLQKAEKALKDIEEALAAFPPLPEEAPTPRTAKNRSVIDESSDGLAISLNSSGMKAQGRFVSRKQIVVLKGSQMRGSEGGSLEPAYRELRAELIKSGAVIKEGEHYELTQNVTFDSPSGAARVILGRPAQGPQEWKLESGAPLGSLQPKEKK